VTEPTSTSPQPEPVTSPAAAPAPVHAAQALSADPALWGRVAEDGTVYVRTADGERAVGSYPGKSAEEALEYFVRKFSTLAAEVALTGARIRSGALTPDDAAAAVAKLRHQVSTINAVGDLAALAAAVEEMSPLVEERRTVVAAEKAAIREEARVRKVAIVEEAEVVAAKDAWKASGDRLKQLLDEWKKVPRLDRATDEELWKRFSAARNGFDKRRRQHFTTLDAAHNEVRAAKEALAEEAERLATSKDWVATARRFKVLMDQWKAAGRGSKKDDDRLWNRFKAAQDAFFAAKNADLEQREASYSKNLETKSALIVEIEALLPVSDPKAARRAMRTLAEKWEKAGPVARKDKEKLDARFNVVSAAIREAEQVEWRRTDPAARARAEDAVRQLQDAIANYEKQEAKANAAGDEKKAQAAREAAAARREWLAEAEKTLSEFAR
jgi:hypothetical protein